MRPLRFVKMQGAGNDFVVVDATTTPFKPTAEELFVLLDRHLGIGGDELLVVEPSVTHDFRYRIWDQVGTESPMCGNGARCLARFIYEEGLTEKTTFTLQTMHGHLEAKINPDRLDWVEVEIGKASFTPARMPMLTDGFTPLDDIRWETTRDGVAWSMTPVWVGNPHAVFMCPEGISDEDYRHWGPYWERASDFPEGVNVSFAQYHPAEARVTLKVWERGTGPTLACGTGATATVVAGVMNGLLPENTVIPVSLPGGLLEVRYSPGESAYLRGPAVRVFEGVIDLDALLKGLEK